LGHFDSSPAQVCTALVSGVEVPLPDGGHEGAEVPAEEGKIEDIQVTEDSRRSCLLPSDLFISGADDASG
jgi:hypothetical protein